LVENSVQTAIFVGWFWSSKIAAKDLDKRPNAKMIKKYWAFFIRYITPAVGIIMIAAASGVSF